MVSRRYPASPSASCRGASTPCSAASVGRWRSWPAALPSAVRGQPPAARDPLTRAVRPLPCQRQQQQQRRRRCEPEAPQGQRSQQQRSDASRRPAEARTAAGGGAHLQAPTLAAGPAEGAGAGAATSADWSGIAGRLRNSRFGLAHTKCGNARCGNVWLQRGPWLCLCLASSWRRTATPCARSKQPGVWLCACRPVSLRSQNSSSRFGDHNAAARTSAARGQHHSRCAAGGDTRVDEDSDEDDEDDGEDDQLDAGLVLERNAGQSGRIAWGAAFLRVPLRWHRLCLYGGAASHVCPSGYGALTRRLMPRVSHAALLACCGVSGHRGRICAWRRA